MAIRNKLMILLLSVSLIPLVAYFVLDISFSRIVRGRIQKTLGSAVEDRARETLIQTIDNYQEKLIISSQGIRFGLRHYADQIQQIFKPDNINPDSTDTSRYIIQIPMANISNEAPRYQFLKQRVVQNYTIDFDSQFIHSVDSKLDNGLKIQLPRLTRICRDIYSLNPETKLWTYTALSDGTVSLYPSPGFWPFEADYDLRREPWYVKAETNNQLTPTPRIEPLTGKTVMTVAVPLYEPAGSFGGVIAMDIDLSSLLDRMEIPEPWKTGAWKLLARLPQKTDLDPNDVSIICCSTFAQTQVNSNKPSRLLDICGPKNIGKMIKESSSGNVGLIRQPYYGVDSLWVYGSSHPGGGFPILIVPYERIIEQADNARQMLFRDNIRAVQIVTILIFTAIVAAVVLASMRAHKLTEPITHLADAAGKLADGDYDVTVEISTNDELQQLGKVFNQVGPGMKERQKIKQSLELAREIQQHFLPKEDLELEHFQVAGLCRYCDETGGDYYDLLDLTAVAPGRIGLVLGDVSGHGIPAAMLMISTGSILRNNAPRHGDDLSAAITELNRHLVINSEPGKFMTLFYGLLDDHNKTLSWASAGHDPAIWYHVDSGDFSEMENTGMPLGVMDDAQFGQAKPVTLQAGDIVIIGTDGIWEAHNASDQMYGKERLIELISLYKDKSAGQIASLVVESVLEFCSDTPPADDITLLVIKCIE
jgi:sigma-B regulation protein RsbU (phosphoserine phosphatase)